MLFPTNMAPLKLIKSVHKIGENWDRLKVNTKISMIFSRYLQWYKSNYNEINQSDYCGYLNL